MRNKESIKVGLMGLGIVGGGVAKMLQQKAAAIERQVGRPISLERVLVRDTAKRRGTEIPASLLTTNAADILEDPDIDIVIEVMGGEYPAFDYVRRAVETKKNVVTANKELMAKHGPDLLRAAEENGVDIYYEASVGGGIPLIAPFKHDLAANEISGIQAIINGTTNYILTKMAREGMDFDVALRQAQELGYAEADPTNDVEGFDATYKLTILATLAFHLDVRPPDVYREGISRLAARDFRYADELGYAIKLLAIAKLVDSAVEVRVHPAFIPKDLLLAKVDGVFNAVHVEGDLVGKVLFYGQGAGSLPTSSAVVADVIDLAQNITLGIGNRYQLKLENHRTVLPISAVETRYYLRLNVADRPGVLAQIAKVLGDNNISIASCIQKETDAAERTAELVIMTHQARESAMQQALRALESLAVMQRVGNFIRVEG